jgi:hypothetical protein
MPAIRSPPTALPLDPPAGCGSGQRLGQKNDRQPETPFHVLQLGANNSHSTQRIAKALAKGLVIGAGLLVRATGFFCAFFG